MQIVSFTSTRNELKGTEVISAVIEKEGEIDNVIITDDHCNWGRIQDLIQDLKSGEVNGEEFAEKFYSLANLIKAVEDTFKRVDSLLDGRLTIKGNNVFVDHEVVDPALQDHILHLIRESEDDLDWGAFGKFVEKLYQNENPDVRRQVYGWIKHEVKNGGLTLADDGDIIGYKGCALIGEVPHSIFTGHAIVDGVEFNNAQIPNNIGSIVEMPRSEVTFDPEVGCSQGLHVGTYAYASSFQRGILLTVKVNPRDIVSVPTECASQKMRVCRYTVIEAVEKKYTQSTMSFGYNRYYDPVTEVTVLVEDNGDYVSHSAKLPVAGRYSVDVGYLNGYDYSMKLFPSSEPEDSEEGIDYNYVDENVIEFIHGRNRIELSIETDGSIVDIEDLFQSEESIVVEFDNGQKVTITFDDPTFDQDDEDEDEEWIDPYAY